MSGLIRVDLPDFDRGAFREAMINAFWHRDYARMSSVRFLVDDDGLTIANPGGFIEGVSEDNLLTAQPRSRNPQLALILKYTNESSRYRPPLPNQLPPDSQQRTRCVDAPNEKNRTIGPR